MLPFLSPLPQTPPPVPPPTPTVYVARPDTVSFGPSVVETLQTANLLFVYSVLRRRGLQAKLFRDMFPPCPLRLPDAHPPFASPIHQKKTSLL